jgi:hypothetical protein
MPPHREGVCRPQRPPLTSPSPAGGAAPAPPCGPLVVLVSGPVGGRHVPDKRDNGAHCTWSTTKNRPGSRCCTSTTRPLTPLRLFADGLTEELIHELNASTPADPAQRRAP